MRTSLLACLALAATTCTAFNVTLFASKDCTGNKKKNLGDLKVSDGCKKLEGDIKGSVFIDWMTEADNAAVFTAYGGEKCCVLKFVDSLKWQDECMDISKLDSIRVVNPDDLEKGKKGENYMC